ncbi:MAG TPA: hypothetical protein ENH82_05630 [bacterium]|nr:hypothetical protein [bacterium]
MVRLDKKITFPKTPFTAKHICGSLVTVIDVDEKAVWIVFFDDKEGYLMIDDFLASYEVIT